MAAAKTSRTGGGGGGGDGRSATDRPSTAIDSLSEDELCSILRRVARPSDRKSCALVCRQWRRAERSSRTRLRISSPPPLSALLLPRFPNLQHLHALHSDLPLLPPFCPRLLSLTLSPPPPALSISLFDDEFDPPDDASLAALAANCPLLRHLSFPSCPTIGDAGVSAVAASCSMLSRVDLSRCRGISDSCLLALADASSLRSLTLSGCTGISDHGLRSLSSRVAASSLQALDVSECCRITDSGVAFLHKMLSIESLSLSKCGPSITDIGARALTAMVSLQMLDLSWLPNISDVAIAGISKSCRQLRELDLSGCVQVTGMGLRGFCNHRALRVLLIPQCDNVCADEVERVAIRCSSLEFLVMDSGLRQWIPKETMGRIENKCRIEWSWC